MYHGALEEEALPLVGTQPEMMSSEQVSSS